jgi:hypothetical protein
MLFTTEITQSFGGDFDPADFTPADFRTTAYTEPLGLIETDLSQEYIIGPNNLVSTSNYSTTSPMPVYFENLDWQDTAQRPFEKRFSFKVRELVYKGHIGGIVVPIEGIYQYEINSVVVVQAIPNAGYSLAHWLLDNVNVGNTNPYSITMDDDHEISAVFQLL